MRGEGGSVFLGRWVEEYVVVGRSWFCFWIGMGVMNVRCRIGNMVISWFEQRITICVVLRGWINPGKVWLSSLVISKTIC